MKIALFTFSGTGNTQKIADEYKEALSASADVEQFSLPLSVLPNTDEYDMFGIGYPVHGFNAPELVLKFAKQLKKLPKGTGKPCFIFKTSGEPVKMNRVSSLKLLRILRKRGYDPFGEYHYCMPYNIIFRHSDAMAYRMWSTAKALVPLDCAQILKKTPHPEPKVFMGGLVAFILRIEHPGARFNGLFYRVRKKTCVGCDKCVRDCPMGNIKRKNGKLKFGGKCAMCMRCSLGCPKDSIRIGLFNGWRVNGAYSFAPDAPEQKSKHDKYCKKAYDRYFAAAQARIDAKE